MHKDLIQCFSISNNIRSLFCRPSERDAALDGIRAISILLLVFFHAANITALNFDGGPQAYIETLPRSILWLMQADKGVDIFFVLSGFLIGRMLIQEQSRTGQIRIGRFYLRRLLRLFPAYALLLILVAIVPLDQNKWYLLANLAYVNNYLPLENMIAPWTWSLAVEEQFYLLLPPFLILFYFHSAHKILWLVTLIIAASLIRFAILLDEQEVMASPYIALATNKTFLESFYDNLHTRYDALLIGVLAAHLHLANQKFKQLLLHPVPASNLLLLLCLVGITGIMWLPLDRMHEQWTQQTVLLFHVLHRPLFALLVAAAMLCALHGAGIALLIRKILASRILLPFGQLAYSMYLFHIPFVVVMHLVIKAQVNHGSTHFDTGQLCLLAGLSLIPSALFACIVYLAIEKPIMNLRDRFVPPETAPPITGNTMPIAAYAGNIAN